MKYIHWLAGLKGISAKKKIRLIMAFGEAGEVFRAPESSLKRAKVLSEKDIDILTASRRSGKNVDEAYFELEKEKIWLMPFNDENYPEKLKNLSDPPFVLYGKGMKPDNRLPTAAIVGARKCSAYGEMMALEFGRAIGEAGVTVVSGMARGIDAAGQRGALESGGISIGVLGCGVDICYPKENLGLYRDIQKRGCVLSEQIPGEKPQPFYFPMRNRIISGMADVILVMEAGEKSGSLITADAALEQGKDVYALPGPVTSRMSFGCHRLIQQGAGILISPELFLEEKGWNHLAMKNMKKSREKKKVLETKEDMVYSCLDFYPKNIDELLAEIQIPAREILEALISLKLEGYVQEKSKNFYVKCRL